MLTSFIYLQTLLLAVVPLVLFGLAVDQGDIFLCFNCILSLFLLCMERRKSQENHHYYWGPRRRFAVPWYCILSIPPYLLLMHDSLLPLFILFLLFSSAFGIVCQAVAQHSCHVPFHFFLFLFSEVLPSCAWKVFNITFFSVSFSVFWPLCYQL